jgi:hypothetical protein
VPFCEECAKYWAPSAMNTDGTCPACGRLVEAPEVPNPVGTSRTLSGKDLRQLAGKDAKAPWHFKLLVAALIVYLTWRVLDLVHLV